MPLKMDQWTKTSNQTVSKGEPNGIGKTDTDEEESRQNASRQVASSVHR
jgi:hypothetical protein